MNNPFQQEQKNGAYSVSSLSAQAFRYIGLLPIIALVLAVLTTIFAGYQIQQLVLDRHNTVQYSVAKAPVTPGDLEKIAQRLANLNPALKIEGAQGRLTVGASHKAHYAEFLYALTTLPSVEPHIVWELPLLCLADCGGQTAFQAELRGYRQHIQTSE